MLRLIEKILRENKLSQQQTNIIQCNGYHQHLFSCRIDSKCEESWLVSKLLSSGGASAYIGGNDIEHDGTFFWAGGHFSSIFVSTFICTCLASHRWPQSNQRFQILCWSRGSFNLFSSCSRDPSFLLLFVVCIYDISYIHYLFYWRVFSDQRAQLPCALCTITNQLIN